MSEKRLTVLFTPFSSMGHINGCVGVGQQLLSRGHRVLFTISKNFEGRLARYGFEEIFIEKKALEKEMAKSGEKGVGGTQNSNLTPGGDTCQKSMDPPGGVQDSKQPPDGAKNPIALPGGAPNSTHPQKGWSHLINSMLPMIQTADPIERLKSQSQDTGFSVCFNSIREDNPQILKIIAEIKPDVIVIDHMLSPPYLFQSGVPFVCLWSANPLMLFADRRLPPWSSGYFIDDAAHWGEYRALKSEKLKEQVDRYNDYLISEGAPPLDNRERIWNLSPYATIAQYPEELNYFEVVEKPEKVYFFDTFMKKEEGTSFEIPEKLKGLQGKLIYFSLGSLGTALVPIMQKLLDIFGKSPHRFIASGGENLSELVLPPNVWAKAYVPQTAILPLVDLAVIHGGNNSLTECFYFGTPLIVLPLFGDQPDNAQRVAEKGFGCRLHPWNVKEEEMLETIEKVLGDEELKERLTKISKRIQASNSQLEAAKVVESVALGNLKK